MEAAQAQKRDRTEKDQMIENQLAQRRMLKERAAAQRQSLEQRKREVQTDLSRFNELAQGNPQSKLEEFKRSRQAYRRRAPPRDRGPER